MKAPAALLILALTLTAAAQSHPINFTQEITSLDGKPIMAPASPTDPKTQPVTLGDVCVNALETMMQDDAKLTGKDKFDMDLLARKIYKQKSASLSPEEIKLIKDRIGKIYSATIVGPAWRMLDETK